jgi:hypothetical protein
VLNVEEQLVFQVCNAEWCREMRHCKKRSVIENMRGKLEECLVRDEVTGNPQLDSNR